MNIATTIQNARQSGAHRPFGAVQMIKEPSKPTDVAKLSICSDPIPTHRINTGNKYDELFSKLAIGQAIKCEPSEVGRIGNAMRQWFDKKGIDAAVKSMKHYPDDGKGRVWMVAKDSA